jgi:hypothetical protein
MLLLAFSRYPCLEAMHVDRSSFWRRCTPKRTGRIMVHHRLHPCSAGGGCNLQLVPWTLYLTCTLHIYMVWIYIDIYNWLYINCQRFIYSTTTSYLIIVHHIQNQFNFHHIYVLDRIKRVRRSIHPVIYFVTHACSDRSVRETKCTPRYKRGI